MEGAQEEFDRGEGATGRRWCIKDGRLEIKIAASRGLNHKFLIVKSVGKARH
jgi:hypothetical protein